MAHYNVRFSCGHEETIELFGKIDDRLKKNEYYEQKGLCSCCYKKHQEEEKAKMTEYIKEQSNELNLPLLEGSEKQVAWAMDIRHNWIEQAKNNVAQLGRNWDDVVKQVLKMYDEKINDAKFNEDLRNALDNCNITARLASAYRQTSAKFFIDNR